jgi:serine/threonine protein kinase
MSAPKSFALEELKAATSNWAAENVLGDGGFAVVFLAVLAVEGRVAVKKVTMPKAKNEKEFVRNSMHAERETMAHYSHQNICALLGSYVGSPAEPYCLVYELCEGGSLLERIGCRNHKKNRMPALSEDQRVVIALGICRALEYLHVKAIPPIIHRDVKSANVLLTFDGSAKLADFGTVRQDMLGDNDTHVKTQTVVGTKCYMPGECE